MLRIANDRARDRTLNLEWLTYLKLVRITPTAYTCVILYSMIVFIAYLLLVYFLLGGFLSKCLLHWVFQSFVTNFFYPRRPLNSLFFIMTKLFYLQNL